MTSNARNMVLILDFGSQYTQLIARRVRELRVYSEIWPCNVNLDKIIDLSPKGLILSGGPSSVYDQGAPLVERKLFDLGIPILGICYGMQLIAYLLGGRVKAAQDREYGEARVFLRQKGPLFEGIRDEEGLLVWMSHGDTVEEAPLGFVVYAQSPNTPVAAMGDETRSIFGVQFHPEVAHTPSGVSILRNFVFGVCRCAPTWTMSSFVQNAVADIRAKVGDSKVICALSGGVDSSVTAVLVHRAVGNNLTCIFVDNGLLRKDEGRKVINLFQNLLGIRIKFINASRHFLRALKGVTDPERKRKIIGREFIRVFEKEAKKIKGARFLAQGTLYPDVIESTSFKGPSATIKTHHNVGGLPKVMKLELLEPLRELFKDEVRQVGRELGLPNELIVRHPFPGPGLAVRILGNITKKRLEILREADEVVIEEISKAGLYEKVWQAFAVLLPIKTVGVMGDERTYEHAIAIRVVESQDAMTADWARLPFDVLGRISNRIINSVRGVNRVVYDISSKPPSTIEWE